MLDTAVLLTEVGRRAAPVPALATLAMGVLPVVRWGGRELQQALLAGVAAGDTILTAALREPSDPMPPAPATTVRNARRGLGGQDRRAVRRGGALDPGAGQPRLGRHRRRRGRPGSRRGEAAADPQLRRRHPSTRCGWTTRPSPTCSADDRAVADLYQLALAGAACLADGALAGALALTTEHVGSRQQFGRPLAAFQAVAQQIADVYIATRTLHLAALSACWRLDTGREAGGDLDVAAYWLADQAPAALRTCHHLHGGIGMDVTYPLHRYSALVKDLVRLVGGADYRLDRLGARVARLRRQPCSST